MAIGRALIFAGIVLIAAGALFLLADKLPIRLGRLPGDVVMRGKHTTFYFPWVTCLLLSALLTLLFWLFGKR